MTQFELIVAGYHKIDLATFKYGGVLSHAPVKCKDGFEISIQASKFVYCIPRDNVGPYTHVELGFPNMTPTKEILVYAEDSTRPLETVYPYVPVGLVQVLLDAHGSEN
jgi:hypothetical protein